jgi:hypothetical protein
MGELQRGHPRRVASQVQGGEIEIDENYRSEVNMKLLFRLAALQKRKLQVSFFPPMVLDRP